MRGKLLVLSLLLTICFVAAQAEQMHGLTPDNSGFNIQPLLPPNGGQDGRPPDLDPSVPASPGVAAVPEPSTIAMLILGAGCAGTFVALRRRRRA